MMPIHVASKQVCRDGCGQREVRDLQQLRAKEEDAVAEARQLRMRRLRAEKQRAKQTS